MEGPSPPDQAQPLSLVVCKDGANLPRARGANLQASGSSQVQPDPSKSGEIETLLIGVDEYKHLINRNRSQEAQLVAHNRAKESELYQRIIARGLKGHHTPQQGRLQAPEAEQHTDLESNLANEQITEQSMEQNAQRDLPTTQKKTGNETCTTLTEIIDLGSSSESDDQNPPDYHKKSRQGLRPPRIIYRPDNYSSSDSSESSAAKKTRNRGSTISTTRMQDSSDLNSNTYHERRPTAKGAWWSIINDEWGKMQRKLQMKWSVVGWIMETDAGKPAASPCEICKKLGAECRVITTEAAERIGKSQAESLKCAKCRAWQRYCSLQGQKSKDSKGESSGTSGVAKIEHEDTKAPVPKIPGGALQSSTNVLHSRSSGGRRSLKRPFIDLSDED